MEITRESKLFDVLQAFPFLEEQIIDYAPAFKNLSNPLLRRTLGKLATLEKVAQVGGVDVVEFINSLRRSVGQADLSAGPAESSAGLPSSAGSDPEWIVGKPQFTLDGTEMLKRGEVPLKRVNELLSQLTPGRHILLVSNFEPTPILDALQKQHRRIYHTIHPEDQNQHLTYIG